jgi:hypothetical protein
MAVLLKHRPFAKGCNGHVSKLKDGHFSYLLSEFECIFKAFKVFEFKLPVSEDETSIFFSN